MKDKEKEIGTNNIVCNHIFHSGIYFPKQVNLSTRQGVSTFIEIVAKKTLKLPMESELDANVIICMICAAIYFFIGSIGDISANRGY